MNFLICLIAVILVLRLGGGLIKKHARLLYAAAAVLSVLAAVGTALELNALIPHVIDVFLWKPLVSGTLATALWAAVMYAAAVPNGSPLQRQVMPIRGELSILASILTLGHNLATGQDYFVRLFTAPESLPLNHILATVCSLVMLAVMLPLFVTSFPSVRRKMEPRRWKKLQRWAYLFYALTYVHVVLLLVPVARGGKSSVVVNVLIYTAVFVGYGFLRVTKALAARGRTSRTLPALAAAALGLLVLLSCQDPANISDSVIEAPVERTRKPLPTPVPGVPRKYNNGTFTGEGKGYAGPVVVEITINEDVITDVVVVDHIEDQPYWAWSQITLDLILEEQTTDVSNVAGATKSVNGIKWAVEDALKNAEK